jgi:hypothetical protein
MFDTYNVSEHNKRTFKRLNEGRCDLLRFHSSLERVHCINIAVLLASTRGSVNKFIHAENCNGD